MLRVVFVYGPVAVIVQAIADFVLREDCSVATFLPARAGNGPQFANPLIRLSTLVTNVGTVVHLAVTIVIEAVANILQWHLRGTRGRPGRRALIGTGTGTELVFYGTVNRPYRALANLIADALLNLRLALTGEAFTEIECFAGVAVRAILVGDTGVSAEAALSGQLQAAARVSAVQCGAIGVGAAGHAEHTGMG
jgi:hypothetical protein